MNMRLTYFFLGWLFFSLGAIGVVLPVVPTTPFMLLALWAFTRSSDRFHAWLYHHKFFGPPLQQWHNHRVIPLTAKVLSISMMSLSFLMIAIFSSVNIWLKLLIAAVMLYGAWFILTKPSRSPQELTEQGKIPDNSSGNSPEQ